MLILNGNHKLQSFSVFFYSVFIIHAAPQLSIAGLPDMPDMALQFLVFCSINRNDINMTIQKTLFIIQSKT